MAVTSRHKVFHGAGRRILQLVTANEVVCKLVSRCVGRCRAVDERHSAIGMGLDAVGDSVSRLCLDGHYVEPARLHELRLLRLPIFSMLSSCIGIRLRENRRDVFFSGSLGIIKGWAWKLDEGRRASCGLRGIKNSYRNYNRMSK